MTLAFHDKQRNSIYIMQTRDAERLTRLNEPIQSLHARLYPDVFKPFHHAEMLETFARFAANEAFVFFVMEVDGVDVGYAWVEHKSAPANAFRYAIETLYVHHLCVVEERRGQGLGSRFMEHLYTYAHSLGVHAVELDYWAANDGAKRFYEKHGFENKRMVVSKTLRL